MGESRGFLSENVALLLIFIKIGTKDIPVSKEASIVTVAHCVSCIVFYIEVFFQVSTWLDKTAEAARKPKPESKSSASDSSTPKTPTTSTSTKKQMSIMAFVKKKKDEALATRILTGMVASPGKPDWQLLFHFRDAL